MNQKIKKFLFTISLPPIISLSKISTSSLLVFPIDNSFQRSVPPSIIDAHRSHFGLNISFSTFFFLKTSSTLVLM
jgi:hypothetical protein